MQNAISIILPAHNCGAYLRPAVESVLAQTHQNFELLLIDDGSTDDAIASLPQDSRVRVHKNPAQGLVSALNFGLQIAQHEYIARMDGDDLAEPLRLEKQLRLLLENPDIGICGCRVEMFAASGVQHGYQLYETWINSQLTHADIERDFFIESPLAHPSVMLRRTVIDTVGQYREGDWPEDYDLWCRALLAGCRFAKVGGGPLLRWRDYSMRTSRTDQRYRRRGFMQVKARTLATYLEKKQYHSAVIWGAGPSGLELHDELQAHGFGVTGFVDINPRLRGGSKRNKPVQIINLEEPTLGNLRVSNFLNEGQILLVAVSARGAREQMRSLLAKNGWKEQQDFLMAC